MSETREPITIDTLMSILEHVNDLNGYDAETEAEQRHAYRVGFTDALRAVRDRVTGGGLGPHPISQGE